MMSKDLKLAIECAEEVKANTPLVLQQTIFMINFVKKVMEKDFRVYQKL
ncbi:MAG: hypothetical protein CM1200mP5_7080 [Candidatus Pelagibacterales bacterium]|nr:MAG: hypothetical protein CM1200mP5_7080 [Pelagibacterales bacterium]